MRIGELAELVGTTTKTIRYYESIGLVPTPARRRNGCRTYEPESVRRLGFIRDAQAGGLDLDTIGVVVHAGDEAIAGEHSHAILRSAIDTIDHRLAQLRSVRSELVELTAEQTRPPEVP